MLFHTALHNSKKEEEGIKLSKAKEETCPEHWHKYEADNQSEPVLEDQPDAHTV